MAVAESQGSEGVAAGLGIRLRKLRTSAGLSQSELAAGRFSKEYLSQIERGKTRPTAETVAWLAERLGIDADLLRTGISAGERNRWEAQLGARRRSASATSTRPQHRSSRRFVTQPGRRARRISSSGLSRGSLGPAPGRRAEGSGSAAHRRARAFRGATVLRHRARRRALPARRLPLPAVQHLHCPRPVRRRSRARRTVRSPRRPAASADLPVAVPLLPPAARLASSIGKTSSVRSSWPRALAIGVQPPRCTSRRRSSPSAKATGCSLGRTPSAPARTTRSLPTGRTSVACSTTSAGSPTSWVDPDQAIEYLQDSCECSSTRASTKRRRT